VRTQGIHAAAQSPHALFIGACAQQVLALVDIASVPVSACRL
jgi:hypothetical protein